MIHSTYFSFEKRCNEAEILGMQQILLLEDLPFLLSPHIDILSLFVLRFGVIHESVVVIETQFALAVVKHHRGHDGVGAHLLVFLLVV